MALAGNLTTVAVADADLIARVPTLSSYLPAGESDWVKQIAVGKADANEAFRVAKREDPARAVALDDADWVGIVSAFTLSVVYRGFSVGNDSFYDEADKWRQDGLERLGRFVYNLDADEDDAVSTGEADARTSRREIEILAG